MQMEPTRALLPSRREMERAFLQKDAEFDGLFFAGVRTTGIFCRPSCPSRPDPRHLEFFPSVRDCLEAGYRACRRCDPMTATGIPPAWVQSLMDHVREFPARPWTARDLAERGLTPEKVRRWFLRHLGMSFTAWCRGQRLAGALDRLREGEDLDEAPFESGFESHSGFRDAVVRIFGEPPGRLRRGTDRMVLQWRDTPIGPLLTGATDAGISLVTFTAPGRIAAHLRQLRDQLTFPILPGDHDLLRQLDGELTDYFAGRRERFDVPIAFRGTPFQEAVWSALREIPFGQTIAYDELARRVGRPTAQRAVANANGRNRIAILIPCHRVVGRNGTLTGYGGGLWRKRLLLELERTGSLPGR